MPRVALEDLLKELHFLDSLVFAGEEPHEIESHVKKFARLCHTLFFGYMYENELKEGIEIHAKLAAEFICYVYLDCKNGNHCQTLEKVTKKQIGEFLFLVEFAVSQQEWERGLNPFDGLLLLYEFLSEIGYRANMKRRINAIRALQKETKKNPISKGEQWLGVQQ